MSQSAIARWDVIIIGAGAAGLMCAAQAGTAGAAYWCWIMPKARTQDPDQWRRPL